MHPHQQCRIRPLLIHLYWLCCLVLKPCQRRLLLHLRHVLCLLSLLLCLCPLLLRLLLGLRSLKHSLRARACLRCCRIPGLQALCPQPCRIPSLHSCGAQGAWLPGLYPSPLVPRLHAGRGSRRSCGGLPLLATAFQRALAAATQLCAHLLHERHAAAPAPTVSAVTAAQGGAHGRGAHKAAAIAAFRGMVQHHGSAHVPGGDWGRHFCREGCIGMNTLWCPSATSWIAAVSAGDHP